MCTCIIFPEIAVLIRLVVVVLTHRHTLTNEEENRIPCMVPGGDNKERSAHVNLHLIVVKLNWSIMFTCHDKFFARY